MTDVETDLLVVELDGCSWTEAAVRDCLRSTRGRVAIGVSSSALDDGAAALAENLTMTFAPSGPGRSWVAPQPDDLDLVRATVERAPVASAALATLLPITSTSQVSHALVAESFAYSTLLAGPEFRAWRDATPVGVATPAQDPVVLERRGDVLIIRLNRPERHNAFSHDVRDALVEGLELARVDETIAHVELSGCGPSFCSGGDLDEFGTTPDVAQAHLIRVRQSPGLLLHELRDRVTVRLHGACIGAGLELPAFAGRVVAEADTWFMLPELRMGLVPGAGGTVSISRRIGRWRTAYLALTGRRIDVGTAFEWGLVDERV